MSTLKSRQPEFMSVEMRRSWEEISQIRKCSVDFVNSNTDRFDCKQMSVPGHLAARATNRHSPIEPATRPQIVQFRRFWQRSLRNIRPRTPHHEPRGAAKGQMDRIGRNQDASLPWLWLQRMTNGRLTPAQDQAVAATARSAAGSRRRASSARPPQPANGSREEMADALLKNLVCWQTDGVEETLGFEVIVDAR